MIRVVGALLSLVFFVACQTPTQIVPLHLEPSGTRVFVDGHAVPAGVRTLTLRSDRPHVVHLEREGHQAQQIVLETRATPDGPRLEPAEIRAQLESVVPTERKIQIEGDDSE
jgi:hypothetical protein